MAPPPSRDRHAPPSVNLAFVVQRYGPEITGGSEAHCRGLATALSARHHVEVLTTCARDYISWKNELPTGRTEVDGITVTRFPTTRERDVDAFGRLSQRLFAKPHSRAEEERWVEENGPVCPELVRAISERKDVDAFILYSYRYYTAFKGAAAAAAAGTHAVIVPTAEDDPVTRFEIFGDMFISASGMLYLTPEEQELVESTSRTTAPSAIIGSGLTVRMPTNDMVDRFNLPDSFLLYIGRIDRNKGVDTLLRDYQWLRASWPEAPALVLAGPLALEIPSHPGIRHLGYVNDEDKTALLARASVVVMPSAFESLSILVLEAWAMGTPVLVNAKCRVLEGQCRRSGGGLFYRDMAEFCAMTKLLMATPDLREDLGRAGRAYVSAEYSWDIAAARTEALLDRLLAPTAQSAGTLSTARRLP